MFDQTKFEAMPKYADFRHWFIRTSATTFEVIDKVSGETISHIDETKGTSQEYYQSAGNGSEFELFKSRPEYLVGKPVAINRLDLENAVTLYESLLVGIVFIRTLKGNKTIDPDIVYSKFVPCLDWIRNTDMYIAPASTQYHESVPGGLLLHTLKVYNKVLELITIPTFKNTVNLDGAVLVSLVHDWCKIGLYEVYSRNVKNEETGKWEQVPSYRKKQTGIPLGHGVASMYIAAKFFRLTPEECLAIRWHMGAWRVVNSEMDELQMANETCPIVHLIQFADQLSITKYNVDNLNSN